MATSSFQLQLPSSQVVLTFRTPVVEDRRTVLKSYERETGFTPEDTIALMCVEKINNDKVDSTIDPATTFGLMELQDYNYFFDVFSAMFFSDMDKRQSAKDIAKKLLSGESLVGTQKSAPVTAASGKSAA